MPRPRDIRNDIKARLMATGRFDDVRTAGLPEEQGFSTALKTAAVLPPANGAMKTLADGGDEILTGTDEPLLVTLLARDNDPNVRDNLAEDLLQYLKNAVNGQSLAGMTVPDKTFVRTWQYQKPKDKERRIAATVTYQYLLTGWDTNDTTS